MSATNDRTAVLHLRGVFDPVLLRELRRYQSARAAENAQSSMSAREQAAVSRGESSDAVRMDEKWYSVWLNPKHDLRDAIGEFTRVTYPVQVRHVREVRHNVPWHQDIGYIKLLGARAHAQIITCFIPLEEEPACCTTLQFAKGDRAEISHLPTGLFGAGVQLGLDVETFWYQLELGDALVFGDWALHRTWTPPAGRVERRSLEFRLIRTRDSMPGRDYFDISEGRFIKT